MAIFGPKPWVNPLGKMSIVRLFELLVFIAQKGFFFFLEDRIRHFPGLYWLKKKKFKKRPSFDEYHVFTLFGKMAIFRLLELLVFTAQKGVFSFQNIVKVIFCGLYCLKIKVEKMAGLGPKPCVNRFGKMSIFRLFELVLIAQKL